MSHFNYEICERFAPIFLRRTHVNIELINNSKRTIYFLNIQINLLILSVE
ncbi:hypothetical protein [Leptospira noguchii]|nr:hypothetical protein [Leptospira noguchii]UOG52602.1 hypothetical protein MAL09_18925 [Leptospira noguchii]